VHLSRILLVLSVLSFDWVQVQAADDIVISDFTAPAYGSCQASGTAFGQGPISRPTLDRVKVTNARGFAVASSKPEGNDAPTGTLTSPPFKVKRPCISFLISGGANQHNTCLNLLLDDGRVIKSATGENNDQMKEASWDVIAKGSSITLHICGVDVHLTHAAMECGATAQVSGALTYVEILVDRASVEVFANHGEASLSRCFLPSREGISLECRGGPATLQSLKIFDVHGVERAGRVRDQALTQDHRCK
jgi:hypothetical protein